MNRQMPVAIVALLLLHLFCSYPESSNQVWAEEKTGERITVLSPMGQPPPIQFKPMAPRLDKLDGKTIYLINDGFLGTDILLGEMEGWFKKNMPGVKTVYRQKGGGGFTAEDPELWAEIKEKADAVVMGMGH